MIIKQEFKVSEGDLYRVSVHEYGSGAKEAKLVFWKSVYEIPPWVREDNAKARKPAGARARSWDEMTPEQAKKAEENAQRAKGRVRRLAMALNSARLMTWTYRENVVDSVRAWRDFAEWVRLYRARYPNFQYVATQERQKRGACHFHAIVRNSGRSDWIDVAYARTCWRLVVGVADGNIDVRPIKDRSQNGIARACGYVAKYITKDVRLVRPGAQRYHCSKGIYVPIRYYWITAPNWLSAKREFFSRFSVENGAVGSQFTNEYDLFAWCATWSLGRGGERSSGVVVAAEGAGLVVRACTLV